MSARTAVVGAGLAGLTAARRLALAGDDVVVFDKARGPGGRTSTRRSDAGHFDHGAQYFTLRSPAFRLASEQWREAGVVADWQGRFGTLRRGEIGPDPKPSPRLVGTPGMSALARWLGDGLPIEAEARIASIERDERGWRLSAESGAVHEAFERVLVTTPAPQAVPLLACAPDLARAAAGATLAPCQAVMVTFAEPLDIGLDGAFIEASPLAWAASQASRPGRGPEPGFVLHATAAWSRAHVDTPPDEVVKLLIDAFGEAAGTPLPGVVHSQAHRWLYALPEDPEPLGCLYDPATGIGVAGDWLLGARVEAALLSGQGLAEAVLACEARLPTREP